MSHRNITRTTTTGLAILALLLAGCGSRAKQPSTGHATAATTSTAPDPGRYINAVSAIQRPIPAAASQFFHSPRVSAVEMRFTIAYRDAYIAAVHRLSKVTPPAVATIAQRNLIAVWSSVASQLTTVIQQRPFSYSRAYAVGLTAEPQTDAAYNAILTLP